MGGFVQHRSTFLLERPTFRACVSLLSCRLVSSSLVCSRSATDVAMRSHSHVRYGCFHSCHLDATQQAIRISCTPEQFIVLNTARVLSMGWFMHAIRVKPMGRCGQQAAASVVPADLVSSLLPRACMTFPMTSLHRAAPFTDLMEVAR